MSRGLYSFEGCSISPAQAEEINARLAEQRRIAEEEKRAELDAQRNAAGITFPKAAEAAVCNAVLQVFRNIK
jgi:hypothetical protein